MKSFFKEYFFLFFYFISIFILLTRRKATEALYMGKQLPRPAFGDAKILLSASNLIEILL